MFFAPFPEEEISDYIAHGPITRVLTVIDGIDLLEGFRPLGMVSVGKLAGFSGS